MTTSELLKATEGTICEGLPVETINYLASLIRQQVSAERERCAKIVEQTEHEGDYFYDEQHGEIWQGNIGLTLEEAAKRIRNGIEPK